jgi:N6-adenosine-specific RNA methylase IME4
MVGMSERAARPLFAIKDEETREKAITKIQERLNGKQHAGRGNSKKLKTGDVKKIIQKISHENKPKEKPLPNGKYNVIIADPPWRYEFSETTNREIENHYPTMSLEEIKALEIPTEDNAVLLLWTTAPKVEESIQVMNAWGFKYRTCAIWDKEKIGMGYWFRIQHELLLIGIKGSYPAPAPENRKPSVFRSARSAHSKKPDIVYEMIEEMFPDGKYLELFARSERNGWTSWGNEI